MSRRRPVSRAWKRIWVSVTALALAATLFLSFFFYVVYRIRHPAPVPEDTKPSNYLLNSVDVAWAAAGGADTRGWYTEGSQGRPGILLAPGYQLSRSDGLSLAAELSKKGFHSLIYGPGVGAGEKPAGASVFGRRATDEMLAALDFLKSRRGVDGRKLGIWGADVGARAALEAATEREEVRAVAADSPYDTTAEFLRLCILAELGYTSGWIESGCLRTVALLEGVEPSSLREPVPLGKLADRSVLLIKGSNRSDLGALADRVLARLQSPKQVATLPSARVRLMSAEMLALYDRRVVEFFSSSLTAARAAGARASAPSGGGGKE